MSGNPWDQDWGAGNQQPPASAAAMPWEQDWSQGGPAPFTWHVPTGAELGAFGSGAADAVTLGFGDEMEGALAGAAGALSGHDYAATYRQRVDEARARLEQAHREHPLYTLAGSFAGTGATMLAPGLGEGALVPFGRSLARVAAGGGPLATLAQAGLGAETGALFGGLYGAGSGNGDIGQRFQNALGSAAGGAVLGGISPALFQGLGHAGTWVSPLARAASGAILGGGIAGVTGNDIGQGAELGAGLGLFGRPVLSRVGGPVLAAVRRAWERPTEAFAPGRANAVIPGAPPIPGGAAPATPPIKPDVNAVRRLTDALHRQRMPIEDVDAARVASVADNARDVAAGRAPIVRRLVDAGPELSAEFDTLANMPGESYTRAKEIQQELASSMPREIRHEMRGLLGVRQTPGEMIDDLRAQAQSANDGYRQVTAQAPKPSVVQNRIIPLMDTPEMQPVLARRFRVEQAEANLAAVRGEEAPKPSVIRDDATGQYHLSPEATGQQLHDLKVNIDDELNAAVDRRSLSPAGRGEQHMLDNYRETYIKALDDALPGYQAVRSNRGSVYDAERALRLDRDGNATVGARILRMDPEEISRFMHSTTTPTGRTRLTTPFERRAYQASVVQEVLQKMDDYVSAAGDKTRNAGEVLDRVGLHNRLRAVFADRPAEIQQFLDRAIERAEMLRRAGSWTGSSDSARRLTRAGDQFLDSITHAGGHAATGNPIGALGALGRGAYRALVLRNLEGQNNAFGHALLSPLNEDPELLALLSAVRKLQAERAARAREASVFGAQGAIGGDSHNQNNGP